MTTPRRFPPYADTAETNAGSLRTGDVLADGYAGYHVDATDSDGSAVVVACSSLQTGRGEARSYPVTRTVRIVHPDHVGSPLDPLDRLAAIGTPTARAIRPDRQDTPT